MADPLFKGTTSLTAGLVIILTFLVVFFLTRHALPSIYAFGWNFLYESEWDPVREQFGAAPFIYGTLATSAIALMIAAPIGIGTAIFLSELIPPWLSAPISFLIDLLAAIPSVIYGLVGIFVLIPLMRSSIEPSLSALLGFFPLFESSPYGFGIMTAGLILSIMIIPFITSVSREALLAVPLIQREAILSLGATRWEMVLKVVLPMAKSGIIGSIFLALARALGETMAVTMVIGNRPEIRASLFEPGHTMAAVIANEFSEAVSDLYLSTLIEIALVLFGVTLIINGIARLFVTRPLGGKS